MKKPCKGEKICLKTGQVIRILLLIVVFISFNASAQIPINGFCKYQSFKIPPEYTSVQSVNFNKDAFNDLIIFNNSTKKYLSIEGTEEGFSNIRVYKIPFEISKFKSISTNNFREKYYAYVSRKNRSVGIISFNKYGKIEIDKLLKFNSYPENLDVADINNNGKSELLISGSAFEGLSIISQNWHGLDEKKILSKNSFNEAIFADLNNDGNPDVAAFNSVERSIYFFFNDGNGRLNLVRTIPLTDNITSLKSSDIDSDGFADIIFNKGNSIKVMWGDSVSSYNSTTEFETSNRSINFILSDYNLDGKVDIAYLNSDNSKISILFSKGNRKFHSEILYLKRESISDLINFSNKINNGIIALTDKGTLFYLSTLFSLNEETNILIGGTPVSLTHFDYKNDGILDIVFIDSTNNNLNFLIRGNSKQPVSFYSYPLFERHDKILVDDSDPYIKTFYTYSYNKKVVEILKINFKEFGVTRNSLYSPGKIISLKLNKDDFGNEKIYIAYLKNMALGLNINFVQDIRILSSDYPDLADSVLDAKITFADTLGVYFWQIKNNNLNLKEISMKNLSPLPTIKYQTKANNTVVYLNSDNFLTDNKQFEFISIIKKDGKYYLLETSKDSTRILKDKSFDNLNISRNDIFFTGQWQSEKRDNIYMFSKSQKELFKLDIDSTAQTFTFESVLENINGDNFFTDYNASFYNNLFYIDKKNKTISIKRINSYENN